MQVRLTWLGLLYQSRILAQGGPIQYIIRNDLDTCVYSRLLLQQVGELE
jgi:hypothetical protein